MQDFLCFLCGSLWSCLARRIAVFGAAMVLQLLLLHAFVLVCRWVDYVVLQLLLLHAFVLVCRWVDYLGCWVRAFVCGVNPSHVMRRVNPSISADGIHIRRKSRSALSQFRAFRGFLYEGCSFESQRDLHRTFSVRTSHASGRQFDSTAAN
jgi:hypothetical protein